MNKDGKTLTKQHKYNTRLKNIPNLPKTRTKQYNHNFLCKCIKDYQIVKKEIRQIENMKKFSGKLKEIVLS